jgi:hypothetical protein
MGRPSLPAVVGPLDERNSSRCITASAATGKDDIGRSACHATRQVERRGDDPPLRRDVIVHYLRDVTSMGGEENARPVGELRALGE